jgi:hypothetical protein
MANTDGEYRWIVGLERARAQCERSAAPSCMKHAMKDRSTSPLPTSLLESSSLSGPSVPAASVWSAWAGTASMASACLLGAWLMGSLISFVVAPTNFHRVDELLTGSDNAAFRTLVEHVGAAPTRELLRYLASELNRVLFLLWNVAQMALAALVLGLSWRAATDRRARQLVLVATLLVSVLLLVFTPLITSVGRSLDFVPRDPPPPELARFRLLHLAYTALDVAKIVCLGIATYRLLRAVGLPQKQPLRDGAS